MPNEPHSLATEILQTAPAVIQINGRGGSLWNRKVPKDDARFGPWQQLSYRVLDKDRWARRGACLYVVSGDDNGVRYVGISKNRLKDRWRTSPATDFATLVDLPEGQLTHSQCMKHLMWEFAGRPEATFQVRSLFEAELSLLPWVRSSKLDTRIYPFACAVSAR